LCAFFLLGYVGVEVALGGWIVTFMIRVRNGGAFASGMTATGFWLGITVGRILLGFVTPRVGEKLAIAVRFPIPFLFPSIIETNMEQPKLTICDPRHISCYPSPSGSSFGSCHNSMHRPSQFHFKASS
jgi:hypothetical protein